MATRRQATSVGVASMLMAEKETLLAVVRASLEDDKLEDIVAIDLRGKTEIADHMVVASGRSSRQVVSAAEKLIERCKKAMDAPPRSEGRDTGDWVLIDCGDVIVHIFRPEVREFYQIEKMWATTPQAVKALASKTKLGD